MNGGRPLRFLVVTLGGWTILRTIALWPVAERALFSPVGSASAATPLRALSLPLPTGVDVVTAFSPVRRILFATTGPAHPVIAAESIERSGAISGARIQDEDRAPPTIAPPLAPALVATAPSRWAGSAWAIARGGRRDSLLGGQLGASQAGARITYALGTARRVALAARVATPFVGRGAEAGVGIDWQPLRLPLHLIAEERIALDGGKSGTAVEVVGGFGPTPLAGAVYAEGYAQAGLIARNGIEGFADGAARATYRLAGTDRRRIELGVGAWGGAQRGAARLDMGPTLGMVAPVAGKSIRLTLDWRQRIAGSAAPGSGPALSIGSDF